MKIYLIRHADRERRSALPEKVRPLSSMGKNQAKTLSQRLAADSGPTLFFTSIYRPAWQTADILRSSLSPKAQ
jgi:phosphohistidine phosphatase SixA